jgi:hypothetical protein
MANTGGADPRWVGRILDWKWTWLLARTAIVGIFLVSGVLKLIDFPAAVAEQEKLGLHPGAFWAGLTILVQIAGSLLVIVRRLRRRTRRLYGVMETDETNGNIKLSAATDRIVADEELGIRALLPNSLYS